MYIVLGEECGSGSRSLAYGLVVVVVVLHFREGNSSSNIEAHGSKKNVFDPGTRPSDSRPYPVATVSATVLLHTAHDEDFHASILLCKQPRPL
jgi:hypothetical protein